MRHNNSNLTQGHDYWNRSEEFRGATIHIHVPFDSLTIYFIIAFRFQIFRFDYANISLFLHSVLE